MNITILVDNKADEGFIAEHGFALWIETGDVNILFDTGQGNALEHNAIRLGIDLRKTDILAMSHGHYDHTGGVARVISQAKNLRLYCHPGVVEPRYSIRDGKIKSIRMPKESAEAIGMLPEQRLHWAQNPVTLTPNVGLTGPVPRRTTFEDVGGPFYLDPEGRRPDPIDDDLSLWISDDKGIIVCSGCAHSGIINILDYVWHVCSCKKIHAVIGGFHLNEASPSRLNATAAALKSLDVDIIVPCHCSGKDAINFLRNELGEKVTPGAAGMKLSF